MHAYLAVTFRGQAVKMKDTKVEVYCDFVVDVTKLQDLSVCCFMPLIFSVCSPTTQNVCVHCVSKKRTPYD